MLTNIDLDISATRRTILAALGAGVAATVLGKPSLTLLGAAPAINDGDILTFALNLEYLEAEFYLMATTGRTLGSSDTDGKGLSGQTQGGNKVDFQNKQLAMLAREICEDEVHHVRYLRKALGAAAVAKPEINLSALGVGFGSDAEFITVARAFEDVGVSAYRGAAKLIKNKDYLDAAAAILSTESYHAGHLRSHAIYASIEQKALDGKDQPATEKNWVPTDGNGLVIGRTPDEVGKIVRGAKASGGAFFPQGLNGKIR